MSDQLEERLLLLRTIATCTDSNEAASLVYQNPFLFSSRIEIELGRKLEQLPQEERASLSGTLEQIQMLRVMVEKGEFQFPIGEGPLERIWLQLAEGAITMAYATSLARALGANDQLSLLYIRALGVLFINVANTRKWQLALERYHLLMAAVEAMPESDEARVAFQQAGFSWMQMVKTVLGYRGDYRLYRDAITVGEKIAAQAIALKDQENLGEAWHELGIISLDPYHADRRNISYEVQIDHWRYALADETPNEIAFVPEEEWLMPEPINALLTAEKYLREAISVRRGHKRGLSLKALVDTLDCRHSFLNDKSVDLQELCSLAKQALAELDPEQEPHLRVGVLAILMQYGVPIEETYLDWLEQQLSAKQLTEYAKVKGDIAAKDFLLQGTQILQQNRSLKAFEMLRNAREIVDRLANEEVLVGFLQRELFLMVHTYADELVVHPPKDDIKYTAQQVIRESIEAKEELHITSAKLIGLAMASMGLDQADWGLTLLDTAEKIAPKFVEEHKRALILLRGQLLFNLGASNYTAGQVARSVWAYAMSLTPLLELSLRTRVLECLKEIEDIARNKLDLEVALFIIHEFKPIALTLERVLEEPATHILQRIYKDILPALWANLGVLQANELFQLAKGARFAAVSQTNSAFAIPGDELGSALLTQIQALEGTFPEENASLVDDSWDGILLTAYDQDRERFPGSQQQQRLANLRRSYDAHLNQTLLSHTSRRDVPILDIPTIQAALDERTVLVNCYIGQSADAEKVTHYLVACTSDEVFAVGIPSSMKNGLLSIGTDIEIMVHPLALEVSSLRENLNIPAPGKVPVAYEVAIMLEDHLDALFGSFVGVLEKLKAAGKDHLCIVPHGPLHYYPFHLLGAMDKPLADNWIITYLPNLNLLTPRQHQQSVEKRNPQPRYLLSSVGLSFENANPFHLPSIRQSLTEATAVASAFGQTPILEQEATKERVIDALENSRYVHLSTHGKHFVEAPAFQCLYLAADNKSDGRLYAYELLPLNLRNLELITLSACETALGRFDLGDNLRGIPANFLLASGSTLVGTLWETNPDPSERFFTILYQELRVGNNRLDAFAAAQCAVRSAYPKYIDWGPFYFIGDWR